MQKESWSASKIDSANYCMMRYYLKYVDPLKPKPLRFSSYVKGILLHELIENFWSRLGTPEEVKKDMGSRKKADEKKKYYDAESFADYAKRCWTRVIIGNKKSKNSSEKIYWRDGYENDSEAWEIREGIQKISAPLFREFIKEGPPLRPEHSEIPFDFEAEGLRFKGFIDEIRLRDGKIVIRDYKSGSPWGIKDMKRDFDPQLTFYNAGFTSLFHSDNQKVKEFAKTLGIENIDLMKKFYINPNIIEEFFMIEAPYIIELANVQSPTPPKKEDFIAEDYIKAYGDFRENLAIWKEKKRKLSSLPQIIHQTNRTEEHFYHLVDNIKNIKKSIETDNISFENGKKCDFCDMRHVCSKRACKPITLENKLTDKKDNILFSFMNPPYKGSGSQKSETTEKEQEDFTQKKFDLRRKEPWIERV